MLMRYDNRKIYLASEPVNFRMSINGLAEIVKGNNESHIHDGAIYVFYNKAKDKVKCLFWDNNGFVMYYKRLDSTQFKLNKLPQDLNTITYSDLELILAGMEPDIIIIKNY